MAAAACAPAIEIGSSTVEISSSAVEIASGAGARCRSIGAASATTVASSPATLFSAYAVSGVGAPGENGGGGGAGSVGSSESDGGDGESTGPFKAIACVDGLGECYLRDHDAEYKLVSALCRRHLGLQAAGQVNTDYRGHVTLWSKKPLCISCTDVVHNQLTTALPNATIDVRVDDDA